ncbi:hypothetical protein G8C93_12550 [Cellulosimicrobium cellulans]|uniref:hypothetical protein n=1 Tax=Cellulosimicrobium cellulans TaxID=1710 RepID=UPI0018831C4F|nr:hypothetical protein [Cellulosimicrobium cellulans]MBE9926716.1 hypothetical protein [Cellulosimicrobium cellulans]
MRCTTGLGAAALAAALLVTGTAPGGTHALWRDEAPAAGATVSSGLLDVGLAAQGDVAPLVMVPGTQATADYRLTTTLGGDNLDARLRLGVPAWRDAPLLDALDVSVELRRDGALVGTGTLGPQGQVLFGGSPDVPAELAAGATTFDVTLVVTMPFDENLDGLGPDASDFRLPDGELVADLWQVRPGDEDLDDDRLWDDTQAVPAPVVSVARMVETRSEAPAPRGAEAGSATAPLPPAPADAQPTPDGSATESPDDDSPDTDSPDTESPATGSPDDAAPADEAPVGDPQTGAGQAPAAPEADQVAGTTEDQPAVTADDPPWAAELLTLLEDAGIDPATIDLDAPLPAPVEQWAADRAVPTTDVVAWLREGQP